MTCRKLRFLFILCATSLLPLTAAQAAVLVDADFASPEYSDGALDGQNGFVGHAGAWTVDSTAGNASSSGAWLGYENSAQSGTLAVGDSSFARHGS